MRALIRHLRQRRLCGPDRTVPPSSIGAWAIAGAGVSVRGPARLGIQLLRLFAWLSA
jgi:hypothetical protein